MPDLAINLLGSPQVLLDGVAVRFDTRKAVALLAYLACTGHTHTRESLAALLWPEYAEARNALRRTLSALQHSLGPGWFAVSREQIGLADRADVRLDVSAFEAQTDPAAGREALTAGIALYRGDFLAGFTLRDSIAFDEWQLFEAERLQQRFALGLERLASLHSAAGDDEAAITAARRRLALDPLHEPAHQTLMRLYLAAGQRSAALRQYRVCAQRLEDAFGATPSDETVHLYEAIQASNRSSGPPAVAVSAAPRTLPPPIHPSSATIVGREGEQARLQATYTHATAGALAAISGQAGIGKTRLAEDLLVVATRAGGVTLAVRCYEGESSLAYAPIAGLLRAALGLLERVGRLDIVPVGCIGEVARLVPDLARHADGTALQPLAGPEARRRFFEAVAELLLATCANQAPGVLLVDDAHWADSASLDLLAFLARRMYGRPVLLLMTWRDEEIHPHHPLRAILVEARRSGPAELIHLGPLSAAAVEALALAGGTRLSPSQSARLYDESAGLPLLVVEYLAALREGVLASDETAWPLPSRARDLLEARLRPLSEAAQTLLSAASVVGRAFDLSTLCAALAMTEDAAVDALEELLTRSLVAETSATPLRYTFGHERLRMLVYERLTQTRRRLIHRRVAAYLARTLATGPRASSAAQIAYHAGAAGDMELAAVQHRLAGDAARTLAANAEAATHYAAALEFGHPEQASLHELLADLRALAGDYSGALHHYAAAQQAGADVARKTGEIHHRLGDWAAAEHQFAAVFQNAATSQVERALASAAWSLTARRRGDFAMASRLAEDALALAEELRDPRVLARAHSAVGTLAVQQGDSATALAHVERGLGFAEQVDDPETRIAAMNSLALALAADDPPRAVALAESALSLCLARDDRHRAAALHNTLADLHHASGDREAARTHLRKAVTLFAAIGHDQPAIWMLTEW